MQSTLSLEIPTERLLLLPLSEKYKEDIFREFTSEITVYMFPKPPEKIEETEAFIHSSREKMEKGEEYVAAMTLRSTKEFLGCAGIHRIHTQHPEVGIWLKKSAHGHKYGREAIYGLKKWADENLKYEYIVYPVDRDNIASKKIPESLGGIAVASYDKPHMRGGFLHTIEYHIFP